MYHSDKRIVMTLDAGGTNFIFSAIQANQTVVEPVKLPSNADNLIKCLEVLVDGFTRVLHQLPEAPVAISFAFPGPADYVNGIIGDLPNLKAFRGGVALGPYLRNKFSIPVFINNDGDLFAYGESIAGILPEINQKFSDAGSPRRFRNLLGVTLGTGFGGGFVTNGRLHLGDNGSGGDVWMFRHKKFPGCITEESVGIAAIQRMYREKSGLSGIDLSSQEIFEVAEGLRTGNREAALHAFTEMGEQAGDTIAHAVSMVDGMIVIGGGLTGAAKYFMPALMAELNSTIGKLSGEIFPRLEMKACYLDSDDKINSFLRESTTKVKVPDSNEYVFYNSNKSIGIAISKLGASKAIALGAYAFALNVIDNLS
ncbi:MAG: ROK family protein [Paludibacter sp.]|jgi:glucokinase|nr:ROK family protein [Paludibacter sp.]